MSRIVVVGGVAAGMSAASQAKRSAPSAEVVVFERGVHVSYGACGMPYNLQDPTRAMEDLVVISAERFRVERGIDVRLRHEVLAVEPDRRLVLVRDLERARDIEEHYDALVLATGASAITLPVPGMDTPGVFVLRELSDGIAIKQHLDRARPHSVVIIGAGYVGLEMADVLRVRGLEVTIVEKQPQVLPGYDGAIAEVAAAELARRGVRVLTGATVKAISVDRVGHRVETDQGIASGEMVVVAVGVRPNIELAKGAGVALGNSGAIATDDHMHTDVPAIWAAGDCAEAFHLVSGRPAYVPLGTTANKQGRVAGANVAGRQERFRGIVGTAAFKLFDIEVARTGLGAAEIERLGVEACVAPSVHQSRGHGYPGAREIRTVLFAERGTGRLLGAQMVGERVAKRIDVFATALSAHMTVDDVARLDLSYAPPFAPVYDPVIVAASVAAKAVRSSPEPSSERVA